MSKLEDAQVQAHLFGRNERTRDLVWMGMDGRTSPFTGFTGVVDLDLEYGWDLDNQTGKADWEGVLEGWSHEDLEIGFFMNVTLLRLSRRKVGMGRGR
jgi:hypothetical protein